MLFDEENSELVFSTGKRVYVFNGTLGLCADFFDCGEFYPRVPYGSDGSIPLGKLTAEEQLELADEIVSRAVKFRGLIAKQIEVKP